MEYRRSALPVRLRKGLVLLALIAFGSGSALSASHGHADQAKASEHASTPSDRAPLDFGTGDLDCVLCHGPMGEGVLLGPVHVGAGDDGPLEPQGQLLALLLRDGYPQTRARAPPAV